MWRAPEQERSKCREREREPRHAHALSLNEELVIYRQRKPPSFRRKEGSRNAR